ncbi:MAG TPA: cupin domain-containing protein [Dehalococcoidia bacterium]|nr:cupin domain-containing protein [Dehalococcoidia bacterium]
MHISKGKDVDLQRSSRDIFTGSVYQHTHIDDATGKRLRINLVKFAPGGRTTWHTHSFEQGLVIVEGRGIVATEAHEHVVEPGDVIVIPPEEKHWHGGTETTSMAHYSINQEGKTTVLEPVEKVLTD